MDEPTAPPTAELTQPLPNRSMRRLRWAFLSGQGLRVGWKALLFVCIYLGLSLAATPALRHIISPKPTGPISPTLALIRESWEVILVFIATAVLARIERRSVFSFGYVGSGKLVRLASGAVWGFVSLSVLIGVLWQTGSLVFDGFSLHGLAVWRYAITWALVFALVGLFEESLLRGYLQYTLSEGLGFWSAALLLSVAFALLHGRNQGESVFGLMAVGAGGMVFCLSLWYTKSLYWAVGFHAGWDWGQSYCYGTANSGWLMQGHLLSAHATGDPLWSGGATGPEASLWLLPVLVLMAAGMWIWWGKPRARSPVV
jgi:membrane protease YdiL (CAAX protease family)